MLQEIQAEAGTLDGTGFDLEALDDILKDLDVGKTVEGNTDPDEVPDAPAVPVTQPGDLWILGGRVVCPHCGTENDV
jgi:hypothetical protein